MNNGVIHMKKTFQKLGISLLSLLILLSAVMMSVDAVAETDKHTYLDNEAEHSSDKKSGDYTYTENGDDTVSIVKYNGNSKETSVPGEIDGKSVTCILSGTFYENSHINYSIMPEFIT